MKIRVFDAPVYLHSTGGGSIHVDIEHPMFGRILGEGDRTFCQGKGDHGIFLTLEPEMVQRAAAVMRMRTTEGEEPSLLTTLLAKKLDEIADLLEVIGDEYRPMAYRRAARNLEWTPLDLVGLLESGELTSIHGIGQRMASIIREFVETGRMEYLDQLRAQVPVFPGLLQLPGMDVRTAKLIHDRFGVSDIDDLGRVVREGRLTLDRQPLSLEESVLLEVFNYWSGKFSEVFACLFSGLDKVEGLRRWFNPDSISYFAPLRGSRCNLFDVCPRSERGVEVIMIDVGKNLSEKYVTRMEELFPPCEPFENNIRTYLSDGEVANKFVDLVREIVEEDPCWRA